MALIGTCCTYQNGMKLHFWFSPWCNKKNQQHVRVTDVGFDLNRQRNNFSDFAIFQLISELTHQGISQTSKRKHDVSKTNNQQTSKSLKPTYFSWHLKVIWECVFFPKTSPTCLNCGHFTPVSAVDNTNNIQYSKDGGYRGSPDEQCSLDSVLRCTSDVPKMWTWLRMTRKNNYLSDTKIHKMFLNAIAWNQIWFHEILEREQHETESKREKYCLLLSL